ncbi:uncharacterized protein LOC108736112 [Agrilus planipennis]|uniref:Uncharacterized protein LOC108736112 n=1 Tax=Agrilus planipennis TaxID=224129 RepID=A0A1W4WJ01_AGRPL|nr:uncharacterized protein LOC108736112 [Agrilus planipennis]
MEIHFEFVLILAIVLCGAAEEKQDNADYDTTILNLSGQGWKNLDSIAFSLYPNVEEIDLSNNNLEILREDVFQNNKKLKKLNLANNKDLFLPEYATLLISDIEELNLTQCNIYELPSNIFDGLQNLKIIDLRNNPLKIVESFTFNALQNPQVLFLPYSAEETIHEICTSVEQLEIIVDSKENHTYKCLNNTIYHKESSSGKLHQITPIQHEETETGGDFKETDENDKIDMVSEEVYPFMDQEQNDQPAAYGYDGSGDESPSESDKIEDVKTLDTTSNVTAEESKAQDVQKENTATDLPPVQVKGPPSPEEIKTSTDGATEPTVEETVGKSNESATNLLETNGQQPSETVQQQPETTSNQSESVPQQSESSPQSSETIPQQSETNTQQSETKPQPSETSPRHPQVMVALQTDVKKETHSSHKETGPDTTSPTNLDTEKNVFTRKNQAVLSSATFTNSDTHAEEKHEHLKTEEESNGVDPRASAGNISKGEIKAEGSTEKSTSNANIFIILGVAVVCIGLAAFGYRWYKNRTYKAANTEEPVERELKEISVHHNNGIPKQEQEPLMQNPSGEDDNKRNGSN